MAQLNIKLNPEQMEALRRYAAHRRTPVAWLIKDYVDYLISGGVPVHPPDFQDLSQKETAIIAQEGGAFDWLKDEPDLYSVSDGEPV